jgi:hypothetical protein
MKASGSVVRKFPRTHILYRFFGERRVAGKDLYVRYLVTVSRDFQPHGALQAHRLGFPRIFRTLEGGYRW